jgi:sodium/pantothenate symporter
MIETQTATIITFVVYILLTFVLAGLSHKLLSKRSFLSEYFLGSRGLGSWALAFTFAATSSSGGSFTGFPSLIYSFGWVLALWIASYMIFPICTMAVLGKRINQVARKTGAITIPDVLRDRFNSTPLALVATCAIIFFTTCNLVAQFKAGALIIEETFNLSPEWGYEIGLLVFSGTVIFYTAYGGFRAVVWTDVMQGIVMGIGIAILLPIVIWKGGGVAQIDKMNRERPPILVTSMPDADYNDLVLTARGDAYPAGMDYHKPSQDNAPLILSWEPGDTIESTVLDVFLATDAAGNVTSTGNDVKKAIEEHPQLNQLVEVEYPFENNEIQIGEDGQPVELGATGKFFQRDRGATTASFVFVRGDEALFGPGRSNKGDPFLPLGLALSFFFMWAITGMGQPGTMVRLMAFKESRTLKRAILTVTVYYCFIYLPLIYIFVAARNMLPQLTPEHADKAMVLVSTRVVAEMGLGFQILGAIFIAAPFAAVMSTVDSFLLLISSGLVRDVYQRSINPRVSERSMKRLSYTVTVVVGIIVMLFATSPPDFLQRIIVFTGGGFAASFLCPMLLGLYWKGMTAPGALSAMVGGFVVIVTLFAPNLLGGSRLDVLGLHPILWGLSTSFTLGIVISKLTGPAPGNLVQRYFYRPKTK